MNNNDYQAWRERVMAFIHVVEWQLTKRQLEELYDLIDEVRPDGEE